MERDESSVIGGVALLLVGALLLSQTWRDSSARRRSALVDSCFWREEPRSSPHTFPINTRWWALIPAGTLIGLAPVIGLCTTLPGVGDRWGAPFFLACIAASFS